MPLTTNAQALLQAYHTGELPVPIAFNKALEQVGLDYTPSSLERIDRLLRQIHERFKPSLDAFVGVPANDNFLLLLGYYIGTLIARFTLQRIEWYAYGELAQAFPADELKNLDACFQTSITCAFFREGETTGFFLPLVPILSVLFNGEASRGVAGSSETLLHRAVALPELRPPAAGITTTGFASDQPGGIGESLHRLGMLAGSQVAWACRSTLETGGGLAPELNQETAEGQHLITSLLFMPPDEAFASAKHRLDEPEPNVVGTVFTYDGYINLPRFRTDALVVEARWHTPDARATLAVPYRDADKPGGFALFTLRVLESSFAEGYLPVFEAAFFAGIETFKPPGLWAARFLDENDPDNLAGRVAEQAAAAYPAAPDPFAEIRLDAIDVAAGIAALPRDQLNYVQITMPMWAEWDALAKLFADIPSLLREGRVVWGHIVQANSSLFEGGIQEGHPGEVLYDPSGVLTPTGLAPIAHELFASRRQIEALRAADPPQPERLKLAEHFENEMTRARALPVPADGGHGELLVSTTYFYRDHLPEKKLLLPYFPLLILDRSPGSVMVLPSRWWPEPFRAIWSRAAEEHALNAWKNAWRKLAEDREEEDEKRRLIQLEYVKNYALHGAAAKTTAPYLSAVGADGSRQDFYTNGFRPGTEPAPREWEWDLGGYLTSIAEYQTLDVERARARGRPLDVPLARLAYATRHTGQMIDLHVRLLAERRGCLDEGHTALWPDEIQWAALGLVAGCEQPALHTASVLCAAWRWPKIYLDIIRPEVRAIFILFSRQLGISIPELSPFKPLPSLEALIAHDRWLEPDTGILAPLVEAACVEHTKAAPDGPFRGLPIAIILLFKLRAMRGLANPVVTHPLLATPLGDWTVPVDFDACLDPLLRAVRTRLMQHGFDERAISAAVIDGRPLDAPPQFAHPATVPVGAPLTETAEHQTLAEETDERRIYAIRLAITIMLLIGSAKLFSAFSGHLPFQIVFLLSTVVLMIASFLLFLRLLGKCLR